jgi:hypothetical protein
MSLDYLGLDHYAGGTLAAINTYINETIYILGINVNGIYITGLCSYLTAAPTQCAVVTVVNDTLLLAGCSNGVYSFTLSNTLVTYNTQIKTTSGRINNIQLMPNQLYYLLYGDFFSCKFKLAQFNISYTCNITDTTDSLTAPTCATTAAFSYFQT